MNQHDRDMSDLSRMTMMDRRRFIGAMIASAVAAGCKIPTTHVAEAAPLPPGDYYFQIYAIDIETGRDAVTIGMKIISHDDDKPYVQDVVKTYTHQELHDSERDTIEEKIAATALHIQDQEIGDGLYDHIHYIARDRSL